MDWWNALVAMPQGLQMFLAGCLGAGATELMRFYRVRQIVRRPVPWQVAAIVSGTQILLAGLYAAFILQLTTPHASFMAGFTLIYTLASIMGQSTPTSGASRRGPGTKP